MKRNYNNFDRYSYGDDLDALYHDDGSHSIGRMKELRLRKYSAYDTYSGNPDECYGDW